MYHMIIRQMHIKLDYCTSTTCTTTCIHYTLYTIHYTHTMTHIYIACYTCITAHNTMHNAQPPAPVSLITDHWSLIRDRQSDHNIGIAPKWHVRHFRSVRVYIRVYVGQLRRTVRIRTCICICIATPLFVLRMHILKYRMYIFPSRTALHVYPEFQDTSHQSNPGCRVVYPG